MQEISYIVNRQLMDPKLVNIPYWIGLKDQSYRTSQNGKFGKWEVLSGGKRDVLLYAVRQVYPDAIMVGNKHDADKAVKDNEVYQRYLDQQPPSYGEQEYYKAFADSDKTELLQAHIPQDLAVKFKTVCAQKRLKIREALAVAVANWVSDNEAT